MKRFLTSIPLAIGLSLLYAGIAYAQGENPPQGAIESASIASRLAGIVAAAAVVERIIEMIWDFYENNILAASKLVGGARNYVQWAQKQVSDAKAALIAQPAGTEKASVLEKAFQDAEQRLADYLKSPVYVTMKRKISMPISIILGIIVAFAANLQMFFLLGILNAGSPFQGIDIFITGLIIGTGSAPVHSLIGLLQNTKDTVDAARALYSGKAIAEAMGAIEKARSPQTTIVEEVRGIVASPDVQLEGAPGRALAGMGSTAQGSLNLESAARRMVKL